MIKIVAVLAAALSFSGCAAITDALAPPYNPLPIRVYDNVQFAADITECKLAGKNWVPQFSFRSFASKTVDGATSNTSLIPIDPLIPLYGAAGGAASAASDGLDFASGQHANVYRNCLHDETLIDRSAVIANPN